VLLVDRLFLEKMIERVFAQYGRDLHHSPLPEDEWEKLCNHIVQNREIDHKTEWFELVEDAVYEYITNQE
jgi:hypothetical protein